MLILIMFQGCASFDAGGSNSTSRMHVKHALVPANLNNFAKTIKPLFRLHVWKPRDSNPNVKNSWAHAGGKCHWTLLISMVLQNH